MKGLICSILTAKDYPDCSMDGLSSKVDKVTLIGEGIDGVFEPDDEAPAVVLRSVQFGGETFIYAVPLDLLNGNVAKVDGEGRPSCFGGCFIHTSDGRFPSRSPIALHDRVERGSGYGD
jgi:hypothetical protein